METQVLIIGGGAAGTMMARELSRYHLDVTLVEKHPDVGFGLSKASNGYLYWGMAWNVSIALKSIVEQVGGVTKEAELKKEAWCGRGYGMWQQILEELDIPSLWSPVMVVATNDEELRRLNIVEEQTKAKQMAYRRLGRDEIFSIEPYVTKDAIAGLYDDEVGWKHTYPWEIVQALAENAILNGAKFMMDTEVIGFSERNGFQIVETSRGPIKTEFVINASGADGKRVAEMANACNFNLQFYKGHVILMDKNVGHLVKTSVQILSGPGLLKSVHPVQSGNLLLSAIYTPTKKSHDLAADQEDLDKLFSMGKDVVPALSKKDIISYYAVSRVYSSRDPDEYIIEFAPKNPRFLNMLLRMPGLIPLPAIAKDIIGMLAEHGLPLNLKKDFNPNRQKIPRFADLSYEEKQKLITQDFRYGNVVCRCETVTEGEIIEAINRGANTLDGVKFRTRAGMGRCQSGFCGTRVMDILSRELNINSTAVTKKGGNSWIVLGENKKHVKNR